MDAVEPDDSADKRAHRCAVSRASRKRLDPMDGPRSLGAKRCALRAQRCRQPVVEWHVGLFRTKPGNGRCLLISANGTIAFAISRTPSGLFVEKRSCPTVGPRTAHAMVFESESTFDHWCDIEPIRFEDPLLCELLRRRGHELFTAHD